MDKPSITPDEVLQFTRPTDGFLCSLAANTYGIEFLKFTIREMTSNLTVFEIERERDEMPAPGSLSPEMEIACRTIRYDFSPAFLRFKTVGAKLVFAVGPQPVPNFRMIERHYFGEHLIKSFDFSFGFCIPNSTNSWEAIYEMPELTPELEAAVIAHPYATRSDSFYFVNNQLVMHNKAEYAYNATEGETVAIQNAALQHQHEVYKAHYEAQMAAYQQQQAAAQQQHEVDNQYIAQQQAAAAAAAAAQQQHHGQYDPNAHLYQQPPPPQHYAYDPNAAAAHQYQHPQ